ncbi:MAG TPA: hypothetical protein GXZ22_07950 [Clostridiaceae bacterium]|nr:hypothetical protein [Clostridiaceae bacterium]
MGKKKVNPKLNKPVHGDPAFYNDQIGNNLEPIKENMDKKPEAHKSD